MNVCEAAIIYTHTQQGGMRGFCPSLQLEYAVAVEINNWQSVLETRINFFDSDLIVTLFIMLEEVKLN